MNLESWQQVSPLLDQALELDEPERRAWLEQLRLRDATLAEHVSELLNLEAGLDERGFLAVGPRHMPVQPSQTGERVGAYRLLEPIGQGGMGTVWLAERDDGRFERRVAVKFPALLLSAANAERFRREGNLLARLDHPHVAQLMDAGVTASGQPYLVLEYVEGQPVDQFCDQRRLDVDARLRIFLQLLSAIDHAHSNLIVHRDIKPSNVLVTAGGRVKLLDFGIGKLLQDLPDPGLATQQLTGEGGAGMTLAFAAPEQLTGEPVSTATDIFALGSLLYCLLCGCHPAGRVPSSAAEAVRTIVDQEPLRPSTSVTVAAANSEDPQVLARWRNSSPERLSRRLRGDLDTILLKALKKNPAERYRSAAAMAEDLQRHLSHVPIRSRPDSWTYRASRFVRRNRVVVAVTSAALLVAISGLLATLAQNRLAREERDFAVRQLLRAEAINDLNQFVLSDAAPGGKPLLVTELLERAERVVQRSQMDANQRTSLLVDIGDQFAVMDQGDTALRVLQEAYDRAQELEDASLRARSACALAATLARGIDLQQAGQLYQDGLRVSSANPRGQLDQIYCLMRGSDVAREAGEMQQAIGRAQAGRELLDSLPYRSESLESNLALTLAAGYTLSGQLQQATEAYSQAAQQLEILGRDQTHAAVSVYSDWGLALSLLGRPRESVEQLNRAIAISQDERGMESVSPVLLVNFARALRDAGRFAEASQNAELAQRLAAEAGLETTVNHALLTRSRNYLAEGRLEEAEEQLDLVESRLREVLPERHYAFGAVLSQRTLLALQRGDLARAEHWVSEGVRLIEESLAAGKGGSSTLPNLLALRAELRLAQQRPEQALRDAESALTALQGAGNADGYSVHLGRALLLLAQAQLAAGDIALARDNAQLAYDHLLDSVGADHPETIEAKTLAMQLRHKTT